MIPTLFLLFGVDIDLAGSLSLCHELASNGRRVRPLRPRP
jgi:hypothetical protein